MTKAKNYIQDTPIQVGDLLGLSKRGIVGSVLYKGLTGIFHFLLEVVLDRKKSWINYAMDPGRSARALPVLIHPPGTRHDAGRPASPVYRVGRA